MDESLVPIGTRVFRLTFMTLLQIIITTVTGASTVTAFGHMQEGRFYVFLLAMLLLVAGNAIFLKSFNRDVKSIVRQAVDEEHDRHMFVDSRDGCHSCHEEHLDD